MTMKQGKPSIIPSEYDYEEYTENKIRGSDRDYSDINVNNFVDYQDANNKGYHRNANGYRPRESGYGQVIQHSSRRLYAPYRQVITISHYVFNQIPRFCKMINQSLHIID